MTEEAYLSVGQLAKRMDTTVRTLRYYDQVGLLTPTATTASGSRRYSDADTVRLGQIQALKSLGFSLNEIASHLAELRTSEQVVAALDRQRDAIREQIAQMRETLVAVEHLITETRSGAAVDFAAYAEIVERLRGYQHAWSYRLFGERTRGRMGALRGEDQAAISTELDHLMAEAARLAAAGAAPEGAAVQNLVANWWQAITRFTGGDAVVLAELGEFENTQEGWPPEYRELWRGAKPLLTAAAEVYFTRNPEAFPGLIAGAATDP